MILFTILAAATQTVLTVFAAASLHAAFPELGKAFEASHPGVTVRFDFDGSQILETQLAQGAQADVFASADQRWMKKALGDGLVGAPIPFATNKLVVIASTASSVRSVHDLSKPGLRFALCADAVPCGRYDRTTLKRMEADARFGKSFTKAVMSNVVSEEENVESVVTKVSLGEADAGIVYRSDVARIPAHVRVVDLPPASQPSIIYPIAVVKSGASPRLAAAFVGFVHSVKAHDTLRRFGFTPTS